MLIFNTMWCIGTLNIGKKNFATDKNIPSKHGTWILLYLYICILQIFHILRLNNKLWCFFKYHDFLFNQFFTVTIIVLSNKNTVFRIYNLQLASLGQTHSCLSSLKWRRLGTGCMYAQSISTALPQLHYKQQLIKIVFQS